VAVLDSTVARRSPARFSVARFAAWHPEWWVYAVAAGAWLWLVLLPTGGGTMAHDSHTGHGDMAGMAMPSATESFPAAWSAAWGGWVLMVLAMMLPVVAPQVRTLALRSLWTRRERSAAFFTVAYVSVWAAAGAMLLAVLVALDAEPLGTPWLIGFLLGAALWQVSTPRRRFMRRCGSLRLRRPSGLAADLNCLRVGVSSGARCLVTCGPLMLAMVASHSLLLMVGLLGVMLSERGRGPDPVRRAGRPLEAWVIVGFAALASVALVLS
jgi:predicted metal-binding membrane protein